VGDSRSGLKEEKLEEKSSGDSKERGASKTKKVDGRESTSWVNKGYSLGDKYPPIRGKGKRSRREKCGFRKK